MLEMLSLTTLPVEVRTLFYDAYFTSVHLHLFSTRGGAAKAVGTPLQCRSNVRGGNTLAILAVSKTVREEALSSLGKMDIEISVMVSSWRQFNRKDVLGIHPIHAMQIHTIRLAFLDSNYSLLQGLPSLKQVLIAPSGEFTCRRPSTGDGSRLWKESEIGGSFAVEAMQAQLFDDIQLMQGLMEISQTDMAFDISYDVGFKFQIEDITWSHGRPNPRRNNFESVRCKATFRYASRIPVSREEVIVHETLRLPSASHASPGQHGYRHRCEPLGRDPRQ